LFPAVGVPRQGRKRFLQDNEAHESPAWLSALRAPEHAADGERPAEQSISQTQMPAQVRLADEGEVLRWCLDWLERLERGEQVVVNLRPETEDTTEYVLFDQARVRRVLARIVADRDTLARHNPETRTECAEQAADPRARHRQRLAEPAEQPQRGRTAKAQREALRKAFGLPYYDGDYADYFRHLHGTNPDGCV
jgi:hypothetical protein